jgi:deoxyribonuclease-4
MIRVRTALLDNELCRQLRGKIPKEALIVPVLSNPKYPCTLLKNIPNNSQISNYCYFGIITEELLKYDIDCINYNTLNNIYIKICQSESELPINVSKAKTTHRYLNDVKNTKMQLNNIIGTNTTDYNKEIHIENVEGHPDILTSVGIFEVKTISQLKKNWTMILLQTFCYAALYPEAKNIYIVLPLQSYIWTWNVIEMWPKRNLYLNLLKNIKQLSIDSHTLYISFINEFNIGKNTQKKKTVYETLLQLIPSRPYQIFFTSRAIDFNINNEDIINTYKFIFNNNIKLFIHSPYLINLCIQQPNSDNYHIECLHKHLQTASAMGALGVVVHVGKYCKNNIFDALVIMKNNIIDALLYATPQCPLLLETPAGQGTEVLTKMQDFLDFVMDIRLDDRVTKLNKSNCISICIDTCHVFASGINPIEYLKNTLENPKYIGLLKLIHFNDSKGNCGSCVDRHAHIGEGLIGKDKLYECAKIAQKYNIPMLFE